MRFIQPPLVTLLLFFLLFFVYTKVAGPIPLFINSVTTSKSDVFSATGQGSFAAKPDIATLNVGIQANGQTVQQVQDQINSKLNQIATKIKALGVNEKDIKTINYSIQPNVDFREGNQKITGYFANTTLLIKVRDINKINNVIDEATQAGANQIGGINFDVDDKTKAEDEARKEAVEQAKKKAEAVAKIAGFSLGKIINYSEDFGGSPRPITFSAVESADKAVPTQVEPGSSEIKVTVTLSYEIR